MIWAAVIASSLSAWALVGIVRIAALRVDLMDVPNARSSHILPTPRGGGAAIVFVVLAAVAFAFHSNALSTESLIAWALGGGLIALVGMLDDIRDLSSVTRLETHFAAAVLLLLLASWTPEGWRPTGPITMQALAWTVSALAIVWSINLFNFMDGIDGLAAAQCVFVAGAAAYFLSNERGGVLTQLPLFALAGGAFGFLVWNFPVAKIFMGDIGSGFIGFALAAGAYLNAGRGAVTIWTWVALNGLFVADASTTLLVRLFSGERIDQAHRSHAYQRLAGRLGSHRAVTLIYSAINLVWCLPAAAATVHFPASGPIWAAASLVPLFGFTFMAGAGKRVP